MSWRLDAHQFVGADTVGLAALDARGRGGGADRPGSGLPRRWRGGGEPRRGERAQRCGGAGRARGRRARDRGGGGGARSSAVDPDAVGFVLACPTCRWYARPAPPPRGRFDLHPHTREGVHVAVHAFNPHLSGAGADAGARAGATPAQTPGPDASMPGHHRCGCRGSDASSKLSAPATKSSSSRTQVRTGALAQAKRRDRIQPWACSTPSLPSSSPTEFSRTGGTTTTSTTTRSPTRATGTWRVWRSVTPSPKPNSSRL
jgi:hypothetical protein